MMMGAVLGGTMVMAAPVLPTAAAARDSLVTRKSEIQVSDSSLALNDAQKGAVFEVVAYGSGIGMLKTVQKRPTA